MADQQQRTNLEVLTEGHVFAKYWVTFITDLAQPFIACNICCGAIIATTPPTVFKHIVEIHRELLVKPQDKTGMPWLADGRTFTNAEYRGALKAAFEEWKVPDVPGAEILETLRDITHSSLTHPFVKSLPAPFSAPLAWYQCPQCLHCCISINSYRKHCAELTGHKWDPALKLRRVWAQMLSRARQGGHIGHLRGLGPNGEKRAPEDYENPVNPFAAKNRRAKKKQNRAENKSDDSNESGPEQDDDAGSGSEMEEDQGDEGSASSRSKSQKSVDSTKPLKKRKLKDSDDSTEVPRKPQKKRKQPEKGSDDSNASVEEPPPTKRPKGYDNSEDSKHKGAAGYDDEADTAESVGEANDDDDPVEFLTANEFAQHFLLYNAKFGLLSCNRCNAVLPNTIPRKVAKHIRKLHAAELKPTSAAERHPGKARGKNSAARTTSR